MQMKTKVKSEKGIMAIYVTVTLVTFIIILLAIFSGAVTVRKNQIKTLIKIKEGYEKDNDRKEEIVSNLIQYNSKSTTKNEVSQEEIFYFLHSLHCFLTNSVI